MVFYISKSMNECRGFLMLLQNISYKLCSSWMCFLPLCLIIRHLFGWEWLLAHLSKTHLLCCCRHGLSLVIWFSSAEYDIQAMSSACQVVKPAEGDLKKGFIIVLGLNKELNFLRIHMKYQIKYLHIFSY